MFHTILNTTRTRGDIALPHLMTYDRCERCEIALSVVWCSIIDTILIMTLKHHYRTSQVRGGSADGGGDDEMIEAMEYVFTGYGEGRVMYSG